MSIEKNQLVHTEIGLMLAKLSGAKDITEVRRLQGELNNKLLSGTVTSLDSLYNAIVEVTAL